MAAIAFVFGSIAGLLAGAFALILAGVGFWMALLVYLGVSVGLPLLLLIPAALGAGPGQGGQGLLSEPLVAVA